MGFKNNFNRILEDIKKVKIQGARAVALASIDAISDIISKTKDKELKSEVKKAMHKLIAARPTEPAMRNALLFISSAIEQGKQSMLERAAEAKRHFIKTIDKIALFGDRLVKKGMVIFTYCHSSTVMAVLKRAASKGKRFEVYNTETRPLLQGRITAMELSDAGIPVTHFTDNAGRVALKSADIVFFGCDAITTTKIYNKIGSEMFAEIANKYGVPVYICSDAWKFDPETIWGYEEVIEERPAEEVWADAPKRVRIKNLAFEKIDPGLVSGIISELGIYNHSVFIEEIKRAYPWLFSF